MLSGTLQSKHDVHPLLLCEQVVQLGAIEKRLRLLLLLLAVLLLALILMDRHLVRQYSEMSLQQLLCERSLQPQLLEEPANTSLQPGEGSVVQDVLSHPLRAFPPREKDAQAQLKEEERVEEKEEERVEERVELVIMNERPLLLEMEKRRPDGDQQEEAVAVHWEATRVDETTPILEAPAASGESSRLSLVLEKQKKTPSWGYILFIRSVSKKRLSTEVLFLSLFPSSPYFLVLNGKIQSSFCILSSFVSFLPYLILSFPSLSRTLSQILIISPNSFCLPFNLYYKKTPQSIASGA
jgi:hypothetical protein